MRGALVVLAGLSLAACAPAVPDSGAGFDRAQEAAVRDAALTGAPSPGAPLAAPGMLSTEAATSPAVVQLPAPTVPVDNSDIAAATAAALAADPAATAPSAPSAPQPVLNNPAISDENDFAAVAARQTIESDAARIEANREQMTVVAPTPVPERSGPSQPNIVSYALSTSHPRGTPVHARPGLGGDARAARVCARYPSPDQAQIEFLERGGPERDRLGVDPDGDGYACAWDPAPFRRAVQN